MTQVRYIGIQDPLAAFEALRPFHATLVEMQRGCRPASRDYLALEAARRALTTAAFHFTGDSTFFAGPPER
jgi:hypothetical protein